MKTRIISGVIGAVGVIIITCAGAIPLGILCMIISVLAIYEAYKATGLLREHKILSVLGALVYPVAFYIDAMVGRGHPVFLSTLLAGMVFASMAIAFPKVKFADVAEILTFAVTFTVCLSKAYALRALPCGGYLIWLIYFGAWITDTGAYFGGTYFGKHKLVPHLSPKKTVEGAVSGVLATVLVFLIYGLIMMKAGVFQTLTEFGMHLNIGFMLLLAVLCALLSQVCDLMMSAIKREMGIKDFGHIMPGHGGILDRVDSLIFVTPLVYYFFCILANAI